MKSLLFTDTHFGKNDEFFLKYQIAFNTSLCSLVDKEKINRIICLGDIFDKRKILNTKLMNDALNSFNALFCKVDEVIIIPGNHDLYYKTSNEYTSLKIFESDKVKLIKDDIYVTDNLVFSPWIHENNKETISKQIKTLNKQENILFGHFELNDFILDSGMVSTNTQLYTPEFDKYKMVLSGHYHSKQHKGNIQYLGSPYQLSHGEYGEHGVYILDKDDIRFIENKRTLFSKYTIDREYTLSELDEMISGKYIKINFETTDIETINNVLEIIDRKDVIDSKITYKRVDINVNDSTITGTEEEVIKQFLESIDYENKEDYEIFCNLFRYYYNKEI